MRDFQILPVQTTILQPKVLGKTSTQGLLLYQKILLLILSSSKGAYREQAGCDLVSLLQGGNTPEDAILQSIGLLACSTVKGLLDFQDAQKIESLTAQAQDGQLYITLTLISGQTYTGSLAGVNL